MTVHAFKFSVAPDPGESAIRDEMQDKVFGPNNNPNTQELTEVLPEQAQQASLVNADPEGGSGTEFIRGLHRADAQFENKQDVLDSVKGNVLQGKPWYRIEYHECSNDEFQPCEDWQVEEEQGPIPSDV